MRHFIFSASFGYNVYKEDPLGEVLDDYHVDKTRFFSCICTEFPTQKELKRLVEKENKFSLDYVDLLSVTELSESDYNKFWSEK